MENTRKPQSADPVARVAAHLREFLFPGAHVVLGLSGGMDSVCLLHILAELAAQLRFSLRAVHVNHGISSNAGDWATFCETLCRRLGIPLAVENVDVTPYRHLGPEAAARRRGGRHCSRTTRIFSLLHNTGMIRLKPCFCS